MTDNLINELIESSLSERENYEFICQYSLLINLQEIPADPGPEASDDFMLERTFISTPKVANLDCGISTDNVFADAYRDQVLTILLDRILTPRNAPDIEFNNYFLKAAWSTAPIDSAKPFYKPKCLLGTLTSHWEMRIYDLKQRVGIVDEEILLNDKADEEADLFHDDWVSVVDLNQAYQELMMSQWTSSKDPIGEEVFNVYKSRMYSLAIVDFSWLEPWTAGGVTQNSLLATFHGNGQMVMWELSKETDAKFQAKAVFMKEFRKNDMVTCHRFFRLSETEGAIIIGYQSGLVKLYRIVTVSANNGNIKTEEGPENQPLFKIENDEELWENDELPVEFIEHVNTENSKEGASSLTIVVIKHPHFVINFKVDFVRGKVSWEELNYLECPDGIIVGISRYSKDVFFLGLDCGKLGMLELQDTTAYYSLIEQGFVDEAPPNLVASEEDQEFQDEFEPEDFLDNNRIHSDDPAYLDLWMYTGFALSPNGIIGCFCKTLRKTPDISVVKDVSACTFASLFPDEDRWDHVKLAYRENDHSIPRIMDVLQAFKFHLREHNDYDVQKYQPENANPEVWELKLYLWVLKAIGIPIELPTNKPWLPRVSRSDIKTMVLKEMALVEETILERYYSKLMLSLLSSQDDRLSTGNASPLALFSAAAMSTYLRSKPTSGASEVKSFLESLQVSPSVQVTCSCCDGPISFSNDLSYQNGITWPGIPGHKWTAQTCADQHPSVVCILSLVPLKFPHRECPWCGCGALIEPLFNQLPICPFCDEFMHYNRELQDTFDDDVENAS